MSPCRHARQGLLLALLLAEIGALAWLPAPRYDDRVGLRERLPDRVGDYAGVDILYCLNEQCAGRAYRATELGSARACKVCGGALANESPAEKALLPADTVILRKEYVAGEGRFVVTVVMTGGERQSIHRPQVCLVSQGQQIVREREVAVPLPGRMPLALQVLDLKPAREDDDGAQAYAYWFVTHGRETPSHFTRLFWMAWDNLVRNVRRRWAYVAISTGRDDASDAHIARLQAFLADLHPLLAE